MNVNTALITGITGQDGSYLAELLLSMGYKVYGVVRRSSTPNTSRIKHILNDVILEEGDVTDSGQISKLIKDLQPKEIYNLAAQSDVKTSFTMQEFTAQTNAIGPLHVLESVRNYSSHSKVYQAMTSELFGGKDVPPNGFDENSPFRPRSPYAAAKLYAYWMTRLYREAYGTFASSAIMFNHESPRRGEHFVTKKITKWCGKYMKYRKGNDVYPGPLELGNIESFRDWGHAKDYVKAMVMILHHSEPDDWVVATGTTHTVREFITACFAWMGCNLNWTGSGIDEVGWSDSEKVIAINPEYFRPAEVDKLLGNSDKIRKILNWHPDFGFNNLVDDMMKAEIHG